MRIKLATLALLSAVSANAQLKLTKLKNSVNIEITNPSKENRIDEPVTIYLPANSYLSATVFDGKKEIASQMDDMDLNGSKDELAFVIDLKPGETKKMNIRFSEKEAPADRYKSRVHAQMFFTDKQSGTITATDVAASPTGDLYNALHHHGPAFESELMAYRLYFDRKQTVDLYGKFTQQLELAESMWYPTDEQLAKGFGDDILRVSGSVGVGTLKGWDGKKAIHIDPVSNREARIIAYGPVRTVVDMNVTDWEYQGEKFDLKSRFTLFAGQREVAVIQQFSSDKVQGLEFVTGVQDILGSEHLSDHQGMTAIWGTDWPVNDTIKYAKETVGLAVEIPQKYITRELKDRPNYLYGVKPDVNNRIEYRLTVCSAKENWGVKSAKEFFEYVNVWKEKQPVILKEK